MEQLPTIIEQSPEDGQQSLARSGPNLPCLDLLHKDIALRIVNDHKELASDGEVLRIMATKPDAFVENSSNILWKTINWVFAFICPKKGHPKKDTEAMELLRIIWEDIVRNPKNRRPVDEIKKDDGLLLDTMFIAAEMGNTTFIVELIRQYPHLIRNVNHNNQTIFHVAVEHRHEGMYNLLYERSSYEDLIKQDVNGNNVLHLVAKSAKRKRLQDVSGVAFQMQRDLLWFREVESMIPPYYRKRKNKDGLTPHELFTKEHKDLVAKGEDWMKGTASQFMVVAELLATIVFAAAFTVPGSYNQTNGIPIFKSEATFMVFVVADAISLFSSAASIMMFLSILMSRYAERDFLQSLPRKLMLGLATLFLSITTMTIAFSVIEMSTKNLASPFYEASITADWKAAKKILHKKPDLIRNDATSPTLSFSSSSLYMASSFGHYDVVKYLFEKSNGLRDDDGWDAKNRAWLFQKCVEGDMFDIALRIVNDHKELASDGEYSVYMATKPDEFVEFFNYLGQNHQLGINEALELLRIIWEDIVRNPKNRRPVDEIKKDDGLLLDTMFIAAEMGNTTFIVELIRQYPHLIRNVNHNNQTIFHVAVEHRHEGMYNLLYERSSYEDLIKQDVNGNNVLHLVAKSAKRKRLQDVSGVAFQMQRDLLWFRVATPFSLSHQQLQFLCSYLSLCPVTLNVISCTHYRES
ncbi:ankyrin repeat-containing domain, PGG domain protein [Tanacetum coccineum]|uniref:Ankyrin repeat-containing domain, PGG domain protein n=1 Tax=Tanacetum coccineum TaxID=301880 RepID=A0ABQ5EVS2_9ASTR